MGIKAGLTTAAAIWLLASAAVADCSSVHRQVKFCDGADSWARKTLRPRVEGIAVFGNDAGNAGKVIVQSARGQRITQDQLETEILKSLMLTGPQRRTEMLIDEMSGGKVDGLPAGKLLYKITHRGAALQTVHSYLVARGLVIQFITMAPEDMAAEEAQRAHRRFLGHFKITEAEQLL